MHDAEDTGGEEPAGEQGFGEVLEGVRVAKLVGPHRAGEDDRFREGGEMGVKILTGDRERVGSVDDKDGIIGAEGVVDGCENAGAIGLGHFERVFRHDGDVPRREAGQTHAHENIVEDGVDIPQGPVRFIEGFFDRAAGGKDRYLHEIRSSVLSPPWWGRAPILTYRRERSRRGETVWAGPLRHGAGLL